MMSGLARTPPKTSAPSGPSGDPPPLDVITPASKPVSVGCPEAPKIVKPTVISIADTPTGSSRGSAKRRALDALDMCDVDKSSIAMADILLLVRQLVKDNLHLKNELADVKKSLQNILGAQTSIVDRSSMQMPIDSYASVTKTSQKVLVINPSSEKMNPEICRQAINNKLKPRDYKLCSVSQTKKGGVVVQCPSSAELNKLKSDAVEQLGDDFIVSAPVRKRPRVRVFGFSEQLNAIDFVKVLKEQNSSLCNEESHVSVLHIFNGKSNSKFGAKLEVDASTFKKMIEAGKVFIGWDSCWVTEDLNIRRCYKCWGFNHVSSKCSEPLQRCPKCSGNHHQNKCDSTIEKCAVCCDATSKFHMRIDTNHTVFSDHCPSYIHRVALQHRSVDYGV